MVICKALRRYRYFNFCLEILEYCTALKCIEREQYYLDLHTPEYNILKVAGSLLGFKHSPEAIALMKNRI
jgi:group I intron endonuclease